MIALNTNLKVFLPASAFDVKPVVDRLPRDADAAGAYGFPFDERFFPMRIVAFCLVLALSTVSAFAQSADPNLKFIPTGDPAMARAVAEARASLPAFLEASRHPQPDQEGFSVKVGLGPTGHDEFFWLAPFEVRGDKVSGQLANDPEVVSGYRKGQTVEKQLGEVTDWMYFDHGKMRGNFSACVLLAREGQAALTDFEQRYGANCKL